MYADVCICMCLSLHVPLYVCVSADVSDTALILSKMSNKDIVCDSIELVIFVTLVNNL